MKKYNIILNKYDRTNQLVVIKGLLDFYRKLGATFTLHYWKCFMDTFPREGFDKANEQEGMIPFPVTYEEFLSLHKLLTPFAVISFFDDSHLTKVIQDIDFELKVETKKGIELNSADLGKKVFLPDATGNVTMHGRIGKFGELINFSKLKGNTVASVSVNGITTTYVPLTETFIILN